MYYLKLLFFQLLYFLLIFAPVFQGMDYLFVTAVGLSMIGIIKYKGLFRKVKFLYILIFLFLYSLVNAVLLYSSLDARDIMFFLLKPVRIIITAMGCYTLIRLTCDTFNKKGISISLLMVFNVIFLHSLIMIYEVVNPLFKTLLQTVLFAGAEERSSYDAAYRMGGLMGVSGGAVLSVIQSTGVVMIPFLLKTYKSRLFKLYFILAGCCMIYSTLLSGRSGLLCLFIFIPLSVYFLNKRNLPKLLVIIIFSVVFAVGGISFLVNYAENTSSSSEDAFGMMLKRNLDTFIDYKDTKKFEDGTVNTLYNDMLVIPTDITLIVGNSEHLLTNSFKRTLQSDIGYIRDLWSFGVFGMFIYMLPYLIILKRCQNYRRRDKSLPATIAVVLLLITLFFNMKEMFLYCRCLFSIVMLAVFAATIEKEQRTEELRKNN